MPHTHPPHLALIPRPDAETAAPPDSAAVRELEGILAGQQLRAVFQPILDLRGRAYLGFEGLIRGPEGSPLEFPLQLFAAAREADRLLELERSCRETIFKAFAEQHLPGRLFVNSSPTSLRDPAFRNGTTMDLLRDLGLTPNRIVIEVTENQQIDDFPALRDALLHYRGLGYRIAIDDLGEGFSNLRMWSELRPEFVKIDRHFVHGIADDPLKFQLVRSMHDIAETSGAFIIAEGIEREADFTTIRDLGIACGQGYFIARPTAKPPIQPEKTALSALAAGQIMVFPNASAGSGMATARNLLQYITPISPLAPNDKVYERFEMDPEIQVLPVVDDAGTPVGLINRHNLIDRFARPFRRELYGKKPCTMFMDPAPLVVDHQLPVQEVSRMVSRASSHYLQDGFVITENGRYAGVGSGQALMALITELQISAARYANPLTQLPGNVPLNEHTDRLLESQSTGGAAFAACYFDIDNFKPFNDAYGYRRGDDVIQLLGRLLVGVADNRRDFVGHVGGDDFVILFQSDDWEERCAKALRQFDEQILTLVEPEDLRRGGFAGEDRKGRPVFNPLPSLSIGAVRVQPGQFHTHHEISAVCAGAKKQAKKQPGSSLFIERRRPILSPAGGIGLEEIDGSGESPQSDGNELVEPFLP